MHKVKSKHCTQMAVEPARERLEGHRLHVDETNKVSLMGMTITVITEHIQWILEREPYQSQGDDGGQFRFTMLRFSGNVL